MQAPLYYQESGNEEQDLLNLTQEMTKVTENVIRAYPDEWLWFQKRWATAPREEKNEQE